MTEPRVTALVLAGGRSSRFGRDKLAEPIDGRPLLWHAIDAVRPVADEILVVAAPDTEPAVPDDVIVVRDRVPFEGPLAGLLAGLLAARGPLVIVVGGDMPTLVGPVLERMIAELETPAKAKPRRSSTKDPAVGVDAVVLASDGRPRPLPMAVRREPALVATATLLDVGERRLRAVTGWLATRVVDELAWRELDPDGVTLDDIDVPSDLV